MMKKNVIVVFLARCFVFCIPIVLLTIGAFFLAGGRTDDYYMKIATPKQSSLIFGTSRAEQAIIPSVMNPIFKTQNANIDLFNYAFNLEVTPYGQSYLNAILKKIDTTKRDGLFIFCVDPWAISIERNEKDDLSGQKENSKESPISLKSVSSKPNIEYLLYKYGKGWGQIYLSYFQNHNSYVHNDGWVEISPLMDTALVNKRTRNRTKIYENDMPIKYKPSVSRLIDLSKSIEKCAMYGKVVLIRIPISQQIYNVEQKYFATFDSTMEALALKHNINYLNYVRDGYKYVYTDGNHMYKESGRAFSCFLAKDLANIIMKK